MPAEHDGTSRELVGDHGTSVQERELSGSCKDGNGLACSVNITIFANNIKDEREVVLVTAIWHMVI